MPYLKYCHILLADASGDAALIEWGNNQLNFIRKGDENYLIATNFNTTEASTIDGQCYRYDIAKEILSTEEPSVESYEKALSLAHQEGNYCTVYSTICDLKEAKVYLYNFHFIKRILKKIILISFKMVPSSILYIKDYNIQILL